MTKWPKQKPIRYVPPLYGPRSYTGLDKPRAQSVYHASTIVAIADAGFKVTSLEVATDPPSGVLMFSVYFDDGAGNGNCILSLPVAELLKVAAKVEALGS